MATCLGRWSEEVGSASGCAWAARRKFLEEHQLYDACIIGGADGAMLRAAYGCHEELVRLHSMTGRRREHYCAWATKFSDSVGGKVAFVPGDIFHLWHGTQENRRYSERFDEFRRFDFDPFEDIAKDREGIWRWNSDKHGMHEYVRDYFASRREDG